MTTMTAADAVAAARGIARLNTAYAQAKVLHSAVELDLFSVLAEQPATVQDVCRRLDLHPRLAGDFLDTLVGLDLLDRQEGVYRNTAAAQEFLVPGKPRYLGGSIAQHSRVHYRLWERLTEALHDGRAKSDPATAVGAVSGEQPDLDRARRFITHMDAFTSFVAEPLARTFDWSAHRSFADIGGARGNLAAALVGAHPHLHGAVFDVPGTKALFDEHMEHLGTAERVTFHGGDFFTSPLPAADVLILGHVLHDWPAEHRRRLIERTYDAVRPGGALIVYDAMLDSHRPDPYAHAQSLICAVMRDGGSEYTVEACREWVEKAGYRFDRAVPVDTITNDRILVAVKDA